jgi:hypothetical protein
MQGENTHLQIFFKIIIFNLLVESFYEKFIQYIIIIQYLIITMKIVTMIISNI